MAKDLDIVLLSVVDGIENFGLRKLASHIKSQHKKTSLYFLTPGRSNRILEILLQNNKDDVDSVDISEIVNSLRLFDIVGFSFMMECADLVKKIITQLKKHKTHPYIVCGGIHPIVNPEDAILDADAVCTGEGEIAFGIFLDRFQNNKYYYDTPGFWFNTPDGIVKNKNTSLITKEFMNSQPKMWYMDGEFIYKKGKGFVKITPQDVIEKLGIYYSTIWTIGCPFSCIYCSNNVFINNDEQYKKIRHSSPEYIINEIKRAREINPFVAGVHFYDDSFMALKVDVLSEFVMRYKQEIDLPFVVTGIIPIYVRQEKMKLLVDAGMNRVRMGVQSGSQRILDFYKRPVSVESTMSAIKIINSFGGVVTPSFDLIVDNPLETKDDTLSTIDMVYEISRPFTLNVFSLRVIPNTQLERALMELNVPVEGIQASGYYKIMPSFGNCLLFLLTFFKPGPRWYKFLRKYVKPPSEPQKLYPTLFFIIKFFSFANNILLVLTRKQFSCTPGWIAFYLHRFFELWSRNNSKSR